MASGFNFRDKIAGIVILLLFSFAASGQVHPNSIGWAPDSMQLMTSGYEWNGGYYGEWTPIDSLINYRIYIKDDSICIDGGNCLHINNTDTALISKIVHDSISTLGGAQLLTIDSSGRVFELGLTGGNEVKFKDEVDDSDADPTNEHQDLSWNFGDLPVQAFIEINDGTDVTLEALTFIDFSNSSGKLGIDVDTTLLFSEFRSTLPTVYQDTFVNSFTYSGGNFTIGRNYGADLSVAASSISVFDFNNSIQLLKGSDILFTLYGDTDDYAYSADFINKIGIHGDDFISTDAYAAVQEIGVNIELDTGTLFNEFRSTINQFVWDSTHIYNALDDTAAAIRGDFPETYWIRNDNHLHTSTSTDSVGIGINSPAAKLHIQDGDATIRLTEVSDGSPLTISSISDAVSQIQKENETAGNALIDLSPIPSDGTSDARVRVGRNTNTSGDLSLDILSGDGTANVDTRISGTSDTYINSNSGKVGISTNSPTRTFHVSGGARFDSLNNQNTWTNFLVADANGNIEKRTLGSLPFSSEWELTLTPDNGSAIVLNDGNPQSDVTSEYGIYTENVGGDLTLNLDTAVVYKYGRDNDIYFDNAAYNPTLGAIVYFDHFGNRMDTLELDDIAVGDFTDDGTYVKPFQWINEDAYNIDTDYGIIQFKNADTFIEVTHLISGDTIINLFGLDEINLFNTIKQLIGGGSQLYSGGNGITIDGTEVTMGVFDPDTMYDNATFDFGNIMNNPAIDTTTSVIRLQEIGDDNNGLKSAALVWTEKDKNVTVTNFADEYGLMIESTPYTSSFYEAKIWGYGDIDIRSKNGYFDFSRIQLKGDEGEITLFSDSVIVSDLFKTDELKVKGSGSNYYKWPTTNPSSGDALMSDGTNQLVWDDPASAFTSLWDFSSGYLTPDASIAASVDVLGAGNYFWNVDQSIGGGWDGYVMTYNESTFELELQPLPATTLLWEHSGDLIQPVDGTKKVNADTTGGFTIKGFNALRVSDDRSSLLIGEQKPNPASNDRAVIIGKGAGFLSTDVENMTAVGYQAANTNTQGQVTAIGYQSLFENTGTQSTGLGYQTGYRNEGDRSLFFGHRSGYENIHDDVIIFSHNDNFADSAYQDNMILFSDDYDILDAHNYVFDIDQSVGAGQDDYVLTYDNSSGQIRLEAGASGADGNDFLIDATSGVDDITLEVQNQTDVVIDDLDNINVSTFNNDAGYLTSEFWTENGSDIYYNSGSVGIGVTSPSRALDVDGEVRFRDLSNEPTYTRILAADANGNVEYRNASGMDSYLAGIVGNVNTGLWTFQVNNGQSNQTLSITSFKTSLFDNDALFVDRSELGDSTSVIRGLITDHVWSTSGSDAYYNAGDVGIGTSSPDANLHVDGTDPTLRLNEGDANEYLEFTHNNAATATITKTNDGGNAIIDFVPDPTNGTSTAKTRFFRNTNTTGAVAIDVHVGDNSSTVNGRISGSGDSFVSNDNGDFGIGLTNPDEKLHIKGGNMYLEDSGSSIIMTSPNGSCWELTVDNSGNLSTSSITCP